MHKDMLYLFGDCLDNPREIMIFPLSMFCPRSEVTQFTIISIIGQPHFGANKENLLVMDDYSAVIYDVLMHDGPDFGCVQCDGVSREARLTSRGHTRSPMFPLKIEFWQELPKNGVPCPL